MTALLMPLGKGQPPAGSGSAGIRTSTAGRRSVEFPKFIQKLNGNSYSFVTGVSVVRDFTSTLALGFPPGLGTK
jgi:hypothetical protein